MESEYEKKRRENINENQKLLQSLGIVPLSKDLSNQSNNKRRRSNTDSAPKQKKKKKRLFSPNRSSQRLKGIPASEIVELPDETNNDTTLEKLGLMEMEDYFKAKQITPEIWLDGHYHGWVNPEYIQQFGIAASAEELKTITKSKNGSKSNGKIKGWSNAKAQSATMLTANPNAYFYRHCAPGVEQWTGEWTQEEHDLFMDALRKFGCGDKWGLFSSYIPHRVGYQCANYYRQVILSEGKVIDPNYKMTADGRAIFCGIKEPLLSASSFRMRQAATVNNDGSLSIIND